MVIPVGNLYRMLLYACELNPSVVVSSVGAEALRGFADLAAHLLAANAYGALRRTKTAHFTENLVVADAPNGRIDFATSISSGLLPQRRIAIYTDNVNYPSVLAPLVARTCRVLLRSGELTPRNRNAIHRLYEGVQNAAGDTSPSHVRANAVVRRDRAAIATVNLCEIILGGNLLSTEDISTTSVAFGLDEIRRFRIFESFVRGFFAAHAKSGWKVGKRSYPWRDLTTSAETERLVPALEPDVVVERRSSTLLVDAKCYQKPMDTRWGARRFRSSHVCQIYAYLQNWRSALPAAAISGLLLYVQISEDFDHIVAVGDHTVRLATVNLDQPWAQVESRMKDLLSTGHRVSL
jgi:5-methylcytosine-specific restriction enzyme subunit McrC